MTQTTTPLDVGSRYDLHLERILHAPRELVWKVWTDAKHVAQWWGPYGFTNPRCEVDPRPGGNLSIDMQAPDGAIYPMNGRFLDVDEPRRLVMFSAALNNEGEALFDVTTTILFEEIDGGTRLIVESKVGSLYDPIGLEHLDGQMEGWAQTLVCLSDYLGQQHDTTDREIVATRLLHAPRSLVWKVWTDPEHIAKWWGPQGFTTTTQEIDVRTGGVWRHVMHGPDGTDYDNLIEYTSVIPEERIEYDHPGDGHHFTASIRFDKENGKTRLSMKMLFLRKEARDLTVNEVGAEEGLRSTLTSLEEYLAEL